MPAPTSDPTGRRPRQGTRDESKVVEDADVVIYVVCDPCDEAVSALTQFARGERQFHLGLDRRLQQPGLAEASPALDHQERALTARGHGQQLTDQRELAFSAPQGR